MAEKATQLRMYAPASRCGNSDFHLLHAGAVFRHANPLLSDVPRTRDLATIFPAFGADNVKLSWLDDPDVNQHYSRTEHRIPMRDGVELFAMVVKPKNNSTNYAILLMLTPYALQALTTASHFSLLEDRFIFVIKHVRGRYESEGTFVHMRPFHSARRFVGSTVAEFRLVTPLLLQDNSRMFRLHRTLLGGLLLCMTALSSFCADRVKFNLFDDPDITNVYSRTEHCISMRDGVKLFTLVLTPKDTSIRYPILLDRTPYALANGFIAARGTLMEDKFIFVVQHVRGRYQSEGGFTQMRPFKSAKGPTESDESSDAWDTIDWAVKNVPNNNGRVGIIGCSYQGFLASMGMIDSHPALKAASPQSPIADKFMGDDLHHNGAFMLSKSFAFHSSFERPTDDPMMDRGTPFPFGTRDGYDFYLRMGSVGNSEKLFPAAIPAWSEFLAHPTYDAFWQTRNIRPHLKNIRCAVMIVGGWYDAEDLFGTLETYRWTERQNPGIHNTLVMGPWSHNAWTFDSTNRLGDVVFGANTGEYFRQQVELPFFRHFLKGDTNYAAVEALMFQTGANQWRQFDQWPPKNTESKTIFFQAGGKLAFQPPGGGNRAFDEFPSDPAKPVPYTKEMSTRYPVSFPVEDQRFAATRPDVLVYETEPLTEELTIAGPIQVSLNVSTTGTDADWVVKLIDVYAPDFPDPQPNPTRVAMGRYQQLVRGDVMRSRFRKSFEKPEPMKPGRVTPIEFTMQDVFHTFRRGHRVMVQVQSSWFPLVDRNPQTFVPNIAYAKPEDFRKATHRVYRSASAPSSVTVGVLPAAR